MRVNAGPPSLEPILGSPEIQLFVDPEGARIGIWVYGQPGNLPPSPLAEVSIRQVRKERGLAIEVATSNRQLYRDFFSFCCTVADRVQTEGRRVGDALRETLAAWSNLLQRKTLLTDDQQIGLYGELVFLLRVADSLGWQAAVSSWQGPDSEEHDFTLPGVDVEVKTTRSEERVHQIGSLTQLLPKQGRPLVLLSVQLTKGGSGAEALTLPELIARVLGAASRSGRVIADRIRRQLGRLGWNDADAAFYDSSWRLRAPLLAMPVNTAFPAIVPQTLASLGADALARIRRVSYAVAVDGLGVPGDAAQFEQLLFKR